MVLSPVKPGHMLSWPHLPYERRGQHDGQSDEEQGQCKRRKPVWQPKRAYQCVYDLEHGPRDRQVDETYGGSRG